MASIKEVAHQAGVSVGTVSRVINGAPNVGPARRLRVENAIEQLGYRPHALAQSLRRQRSDTLGLLVPDIANPFFAELARAVMAAAAPLGYGVLLAVSDENPDSDAAQLRALAHRRVDGLVMVPSVATSRLPADVTIPIVVVDRRLRGVDSVSSDHEHGARIASQYLVGEGHRLIAFIAGPSGLEAADRRRHGWASVVQSEFERYGIDPASYSVVGSFDYESGYRCATTLMSLEPRPTAILCSNDQQAIGAIRACVDLGVPVPEGVSIVGFDDTALSSLMTPRLTTVAQPVHEIGRIAVERLVAGSGRTRSTRAHHVVLTPRLVIRDSSAVPPEKRSLAVGRRKEVYAT